MTRLLEVFFSTAVEQNAWVATRGVFSTVVEQNACHELSHSICFTTVEKTRPTHRTTVFFSTAVEKHGRCTARCFRFFHGRGKIRRCGSTNSCVTIAGAKGRGGEGMKYSTAVEENGPRAPPQGWILPRPWKKPSPGGPKAEPTAVNKQKQVIVFFFFSFIFNDF